MKIVIDCREPLELIQELENLINSKNDNSSKIIFEKKALDIGDVIIYLDDTDYLNTDKQIIFERKSLADLISSIKDGRYSEQSYRLDNYPIHNHNIYYIIEGNIDKFSKTPRNIKNSTIKQTIYSTIFTLTYYKGFSLINSQDTQETAMYIYRFLDKLLREKQRKAYYHNTNNEILSDNNVDNQLIDLSNNKTVDKNTDFYSSCIKTTKKSNITIDNILEIMLIQIPGVCPAAARAVSNKYNTIKDLINNLENDTECLNNIIIEQNRSRRLSKIAKTNIFKYILQKDELIEINNITNI